MKLQRRNTELRDSELSKSKQEWVRQDSVKRNRQDSERRRTANTASGVKFKLQGTQGTNKQANKTELRMG